MQNQPDMLDFVKAMSDADRLRIIGVLAHQSADAARVAAELGMPLRDAFGHLAFLEHVGVVRLADESYSLDAGGLEALSKRQLKGGQLKGGREAYVPAPGLADHSRKVLTTCLKADGAIRQIPSQPAKLRVLLEYLMAAFTPGVDYTEKEVNTVLRRFHLDVAGLRRDLIDSGLMAREGDGSRYWRVS
jgi:hypothetical protein